MADRSPIVTLTINPALDLSAAVEDMRPFSKLRCSQARRCPGGGGINVARVVKRMGGDALAVYPAGGPIGAFLTHLIDREHIERTVVEIAGDTREDVTITESKTGQQYRFVLPGPVLREEEWVRCIDEVAARIDASSLLVASGSLPPGVPDDFYGRLAARAKHVGARLVVDTSSGFLRPALDAGAYLIKPNLREFRGLLDEPLPDETSWVAGARRLIASGAVEAIALSLAERGALLVTGDLALRAAAPKVTAVSTVGAGDSFLGGLVWSLAARKDMTEAFRMAVAAGTAALLSEGTELCHRADVERLAEQIAVESI